jgi:hypothetical protein
VNRVNSEGASWLPVPPERLWAMIERFGPTWSGRRSAVTTAGVQMLRQQDASPAPPGPNGNGTLFGLAVVPGGSGVYFVDDGTNTLNLLH